MSDTPTQTRSLAELRPQPVQAPQRYSVALTDSQGFELAQRAAKLLAASQLVPKEYQGNIPNCVIALNMAQRVGADPLQVMQNLVVVHGKPTWSSQFLIATVNSSGRFSALRYEFFGDRDTDGWGCRAWAIEKGSGEKLIGTDVTIGMAKLEGWHGKNGSKWKTMPQQMLMYRAGAWWTRAYAPELSMGLQTADEAHDIIDMNPDGSVASVTTETLRNSPREMRPAEVVQTEQPAAAPAARAETVNQETGEIKGAAPAATNTAPAADAGAPWEPTAEELADIQARELAEANGQQPAQQPRARRERATAGGME